MMRTNLFWICVLSLISVAGCDIQKSVLLGDSVYQIPAEYLITPPSVFEMEEGDSDAGMVGLTFNQDQDFSEYLGADAWLPKNSITAILYSREGTKLTGISPLFSRPVEFSIEGKQLVEFENSYRLFNGNTRISWQAFPKQQTIIYETDVKAKWVADCIPMGGMKGSEQSHESIDIPTSCRIDIEYQNVILSLTTSEKNLIGHADKIINSVLRKIDSWRVLNGGKT
ncbi:hypothetical protein ACFO3I_01815 [Rheinheimera marina]|uniref:ABC-type transport auxiliary lipoprotein component domain-containing protein n=1 Tax=Rheinheimera marina TaxID=1774958 RepID=A0ABV9JIJ3_9GAMM